MREKLIELIMDKPFGRATEEEETEHIEDVADYLIANGVTVQEWISVKDRLPEKLHNVLTATKYGDWCCIELDCIDSSGGWNGDFFRKNEVTHWMPLPPAPKGE